MFIKQYENRNVRGVILCKIGDSALEIVCKEINIDVVVYNL